MQERAHEPDLEPPSYGMGGQDSSEVSVLDDSGQQPVSDALAFIAKPYVDSDLARNHRLDDLLSMQEYERLRLGRELHDSAGQLLISLQLGISRFRDIAEQAGQGELIDDIRDTIQRIDTEIRSLAFLQYPAELGDQGVCVAIKSLTTGFGRRTGIETAFECVGDSAAVDPAVSLSLLRVTQEALANIHRHAHASFARVVLERGPDGMRLTISDDGSGISTEAEGGCGIGLVGMRHRIESLGGRFTVARLSRGTRISASVPLAA